MPYKNPERKRQWEREHREQRNANRRLRQLVRRAGQASAPNSARQIAALRNVRKPMPDPGSDQKPKTGWKEILGLAVGIGIVLLVAFAGITHPDTGGHGSGNST